MIKLYKFGPIGEVCDASPFCAKVEAYLRLAELPYETVCGPQNLRKAPKGKLPFIEDQGKRIADSAFILHYLQQTYGNRTEPHLDRREKAIAHAFGKMLDENLYWVLVHARWRLKQNAAALERTFFAGIPAPLNRLAAWKIRRNILSRLDQQGIGRHSDADIYQIGDRDLLALADFLGDKAYFFGNQPCSLDATAYAVLAQFIKVKVFTGPIFDRAANYHNLAEFTRRFHTAYFP